MKQNRVQNISTYTWTMDFGQRYAGKWMNKDSLFNKCCCKIVYSCAKKEEKEIWSLPHSIYEN